MAKRIINDIEGKFGVQVFDYWKEEEDLFLIFDPELGEVKQLIWEHVKDNYGTCEFEEENILRINYYSK